ncbi:putative ribonuclease H-like domain-containing protein, partial [Tanacetum coccineum]
MPDENQILLKVPRQNNMYSFDMKTPGLLKDYACLIAKATSDESKLWHRRLGHINFKHLNKLVKGNLVRGLPSKVFRNDHTCIACQKGKQHKASYKAKLGRTITIPLHTLHMDLFEPTHVPEPTTHLTSPSPEPDNEPTEHTFDQPSTEHQPLSPRQEPKAPQSQYPSHLHVPEARSLTAKDLLHMVPTLIIKVDSLETELKQTKQTMGKAIVKLVKNVKKLENILKRRNVVLTKSEDEEPEDQG